jgi:hypothetical protein
MMNIHGADSHLLASDVVELAVTAQGGHMAPVGFHLADGRKVMPYALAPWLPDELDAEMPVLLRQLRGDFFCFPFGPQADGPPHGETANGIWELVERRDGSMLKLALDAGDTRGRIVKTLSLRPGQTAVYIEHEISGVEGSFNYGTHPILDLSGVAEREARISTSPLRWSSVYPGMFSDPNHGAFGALQPGAAFDLLDAVPLASGGATDVSRYPARAGSDDLVMLVNDPGHGPFAWTAVAVDGFVWFALKNPVDFPATLLWLSNGGRLAAPWSGRHRGRLGLEDVCSHFCDGVETSREDRLGGQGIATCRRFRAEETVRLAVIQGVAGIPGGFGKVVAITGGSGSVTLHGEFGAAVEVPLDWQFVA